MCGRLTLKNPPRYYASHLDANIASSVEDAYEPSFNLAPTRTLLGAYDLESAPGFRSRTLEAFKWGLVPSWAKEETIARRSFNARGETVATNGMFKAAFAKRRLLVPADSFYEWTKPPHGKGQPYLFQRADGQPLVFAGLWEPWRKSNDGPWLLSATIITTDAGPDMGDIHDRMPVILEPDVWDIWTDPEQEDRNQLEALLVPSARGTLVHYPVDARVGNVNNDDPALIQPGRIDAPI